MSVNSPVFEPPPARRRGKGRFWSFFLVILCFELGAFLIVFPWLAPWNNNSVADAAPWLAHIWTSGYFRGALSGLGVLNLLISFQEIGRFRHSAG